MPQTDKKPTLWAITHVADTAAMTLGSFDDYLRAYGVEPLFFNRGTPSVAQLDPTHADLVMIMGGPMGVYDAPEHPYLYDEMRFIERCLKAGTPILGICLGSQLLAHVLGGRAYKGKAGKELGWHQLSVSPQGKHSPVRHFDATKTWVPQWHGDTFDLPTGAKHLAFNERYENQAFSYGDNILALQFHPEASSLKFELWYETGKADMARAGLSWDALVQESLKKGPILQQQTNLFLAEWIGKVAPQLLEAAPDSAATLMQNKKWSLGNA